MFGKEFLEVGIDLLYVVINISGMFLFSLFSIAINRCSFVTSLVFIQALNMVSWGYSLQIKIGTYVFQPPINIGVQSVFF